MELGNRLLDTARSELSSAAAFAGTLLAAMLARGWNDRVGGAGKAAGYICYLAGAAALTALFTRSLAYARDAAAQIADLTQALSPLLAAVLAAMGAQASAGLLPSVAALMQSAMASLLTRLAPTLAAASAALAAAGNLHETMRLKKLGRLLTDGVGWMSGILITVFLGVASLGGLLSSARDGVTLRAAKYAVDNLFPVVGGELADTLEAVAGSALVIKNALGVTGAVLLVSLCAGPLIRLTLSLLACRLAAALAEPVADGAMLDMAEGFALAFRALLICLATAAALTLILVGSAVSAGGAVASLVS